MMRRKKCKMLQFIGVKQKKNYQHNWVSLHNYDDMIWAQLIHKAKKFTKEVIMKSHPI